MLRPDTIRIPNSSKISKIKAKIAEFQKEREFLSSPSNDMSDTRLNSPTHRQESIITLGSIMTDSSYKVVNDITDSTRQILVNYRKNTNTTNSLPLNKLEAKLTRPVPNPKLNDFNDDLDDYSLDLSDHSPVHERGRKSSKQNNRKSLKSQPSTQSKKPQTSRNVVITVNQPYNRTSTEDIMAEREESDLGSTNSLDESAENTASVIASEVAENSFCIPLSHRLPAVDWTSDLDILKQAPKQPVSVAGKYTLDDYVKKILYGDEKQEKVEEKKFGAKGEFSLELTAKKVKMFLKDEIPPNSASHNNRHLYHLK